jgi:tetratricopeptide (TPR) repeat protein
VNTRTAAELDRLIGHAEQLQQQGRWAEAEQLLRSLTLQFVDSAAVQRALAILLSRTRRLAEAIAPMQQATRLDPDNAALLCELGRMLAAGQRLPEALDAFQRASELAPRSAETWFFLGVTLERAQRPTEALDALRTALGLAPGDVRTLEALARLEFQIGEAEDALPLWQKLCALQPGQSEFWLKHGECLTRCGRHAEARAVFTAALRRLTDSAELWLGLAQAEEDAGDKQAAERAYRHALQLRPSWALALGGLLDLMRDKADDALLTDALQLQAGQALSDADRAILGYGIGKVFDRRGEHARAAASWIDANGARRRFAGNFDRAAMAHWVERTIEDYTRPDLPCSGIEFAGQQLPVFVLGMPRSGTTLAEQIIAAHPEAAGCGELPDIALYAQRLQHRVSAPPNAGSDAELGAQMQALANRFLAKLRRIGGDGALRAVDKSPLNFFHLGLIHALFPRARVVWCRREPRDIALSIFSENFALESHFATDIDDILWLHELHVTTMQTWRQRLGIEVMELDYESLVAEPEGHIRGLIEFLDLPWDDACLRFHQSDRNVQTPSRWQVRQPIYAGSVARWRRYPELFGASRAD